MIMLQAEEIGTVCVVALSSAGGAMPAPTSRPRGGPGRPFFPFARCPVTSREGRNVP